MTCTKRIAGAALGVAVLGGGLSAAPAQAGYLVTLTQVGSNVVAAGSGTIDLTGLTFEATAGPSVSELFAAEGLIATGSSGATPDVYSGFTGPASFGTGPGIDASSGNGDYVGVDGTADILAVPEGYVSGSSLSDSATYDNASLASLGLTPGTYVWSWGSGPADDTFTLTIEPASVPEPASGLLLALPLGLLMLLGARHRPAARDA